MAGLESPGTERWLLERAMSMLAAVLEDRDRKARRLVLLPPEGATLHEIERAALVAALDRTGWVQKKAAEMLGTTARVMNSKMARYNLYQDNPHGPTARVIQHPKSSLKLVRKPMPRQPGKDWRLRAAELE